MKYFCFSLLLFTVFFLSACGDIKSKKSTIEIEDNNRHYYPILTGEVKDISFNLKNTGKNPLMITDIITSCGCLDINDDENSFSIPPGKDRLLTLRYNSAKNVGYVKHYITLYGNFEKEKFKELVFDINVVPGAMYTKDYEELYAEDMKMKGVLEDFVDGDASNRGYYLSEDLK